MPYSTIFPGQEPGEKIIMILRRHWLVFARVVITHGFFAILPLILRPIIINYTDFLSIEIGRVVLNLLLSVYYIFVVTFFFRGWLDHYLDVWVITSERVVSIEQKGLFSRQISAQRLYRIQDVTSEVQGIISTFFHYGNVHVQSAGSEPRFVFKQTPHPYDVTRKLTMLVNWKKKVLAQETNGNKTNNEN